MTASPRERIRIMRIIARMNVGGPAVQITGIEQNIDTNLFQNILLTGECDTNEIDYLIANQIRLNVNRVPGLGKSIRFMEDIKVLILIRKLIRKFDPDIVHTHTAKAGLLGRIAALSFRREIRLVHTFHGHLLHGYFNSILTAMIVKMERGLAMKTDVLIAVGRKVRDELIAANIGSLSQYRIVNPGLSIAQLPSRKDAANRFGLRSENRYVCWLGRMVQIKRPDRLLEIAAWLKSSHPDVRIVVAGDGPMREKIEQLAKSSELPIEFVGWVLDIESILALSEMMILTSDNEGTPLSLIQAQMAGLPVVATDVGSISEIVLNNETGFVVPANTQFLTEAIEKLLLDRDNSRLLGHRGKIRALELYSVERLVRDHEKIYLDLIESVQPPSRP